MTRFSLSASMLLTSALVFWAGACSSGGGGGGGAGTCPETNLDIAVCNPTAGPFSSTPDNEFFPLAVGTRLVLEGEDDGETIRVEIDVLDQTEDVAGVTTRVVRSAEYEDDELVEMSWDWFAQAPDGTVCYFGEDVDNYEDGEIVDHEGAWRAGESGYLPGIMMPGEPTVGMVHYQEYAPGRAEDLSEVVRFGESIDVPAGVFDDTMTVEDCNPIEGGAKDRKVYVRGIGLAIDEEAELVSFQ